MALQLHRYNPSSEALVAEAFALGLKLDLKIDDVTIEDVVFDHNHKVNLQFGLKYFKRVCIAKLSILMFSNFLFVSFINYFIDFKYFIFLLDGKC